MSRAKKQGHSFSTSTRFSPVALCASGFVNRSTRDLHSPPKAIYDLTSPDDLLPRKRSSHSASKRAPQSSPDRRYESRHSPRPSGQNDQQKLVRELASVFAQKERAIADKNSLAARVQQLETENLSLQQRLDGGTLPATPTSDSVHQQLVQERHTTAQLEQELVNVKLAAEEAQREARHYFDQIQRQKQQITELQRQVTVGHLERADPDLQAARPEQSFGSRTGQPNGREEEVQIALAELRQQLEADKERALAEQRRAFEETALAEARDVAVKDASDMSMKNENPKYTIKVGIGPY